MTPSGEAGNLVWEADYRDWIALLKPRVLTLVVFTGVIGLIVAETHLWGVENPDSAPKSEFPRPTRSARGYARSCPDELPQNNAALQGDGAVVKVREESREPAS